MEFTLICPNDGRVDLGIEDISAVVFKGPESVDIVFTCPQCGSQLRASLQVPNLLVAAMELARYAEESGAEVEFETPDGEPDDGTAELDRRIRAERERAGEPYCEYFKRQLARVESVEDLLAEIDQP